MKSGTLWGIHAESSSQAVPLMQKYQAAGVQIAALLAHENPGLCTDAKRIDPNILTIARWHNPKSRWEGGQDVASWSQQEREDFAAKGIQLIFDRTNDTEYQASDYFCPGLNEWDPPEPNGVGYRAMAEVLIMLCNEATRRSPEMTSRGLHPIRLAIPGFNNGTPEWNEMQAMKATGLFDLMKARGDILIVHEGLWWDEPVDHGFGDRIPGYTGTVPPGAGSQCGRFNYWYGALGVQVPFVVTEWYDGNRRETDPAKRLAAMKWYDRLCRRNPWCRGFCPFELTDIVNGPWWLVDFTPTFQSDAMLADMVSEKDKPNPTPSPVEIIPMPDAQAAITAALAQLEQVKQTLQGGLAAEHTLATLSNQSVINMFAKAFTTATYIAKIGAALSTAQQTTLFGSRLALYTGPSVEHMTGLTADERGKLIAAL